MLFKSPYCSITRSTWHLPHWGLPDFIESLLSVTLNKRNVKYLITPTIYNKRCALSSVFYFQNSGNFQHFGKNIAGASPQAMGGQKMPHQPASSSASFAAAASTASKSSQKPSQFSRITVIFCSFAAISRTRASSPKISAPIVLDELFTACT